MRRLLAAPSRAFAQRRVRARGLEYCIRSGVDTLLGLSWPASPSQRLRRFSAGLAPTHVTRAKSKAPDTAHAFRIASRPSLRARLPFEGLTISGGWMSCQLSRASAAHPPLVGFPGVPCGTSFPLQRLSGAAAETTRCVQRPISASSHEVSASPWTFFASRLAPFKVFPTPQA